ncbi:Zinc/iron permease [Gonapodya prolifera JEL478]|uniref:Zinc/iron permease n=1 Tax=Gonapodya prolifera (strain JEL478) TaxID=1344416 RepID=A0A139AGZ6_GONPJ|nr:Zinc/iron permease [Gonapodya prolifera JEL478]|eukprot:KXS16018.1 Zinc/iron permease [Gonapodya prolifera JEL478]
MTLNRAVAGLLISAALLPVVFAQDAVDPEGAAADAPADGGAIDQCAADNGDPPERGLHIAAVFIQVAISLSGTLIPILLKKFNLASQWTDTAFDIVRNFGTGVILATGFVHMLIPAAQLLTSPCLPSGWTDYSGLPAVFAMAGIMVVQFVQTAASALLTYSMSRRVSTGSEDPEKSKEKTPTEVTVIGNEHSDADGHHHLREELFGTGPQAQELKKKQLTVYILELGIASHSFFVGLALGTSRGSELRALMVALAFHQFFEGMALSATVIDAKFISKLPLIIMVCLYTVITPVGVTVGAVINDSFNPNSPAALLTQGIVDAFAAGILIYDSLVNLLHQNVTANTNFHLSSLGRKALLFGAFYVGAGIMAFIGKYA